MKRTRRQSRHAAAAAAAAATEEGTEEAASSQTRETSPAPTQSTLFVPIPDDLDTDLLYSLLPDASLDSPSQDDILSLYRLLVAQASDVDATQRDLEATKADVERKAVELDQALQDKETGTKELEVSLEDMRTELRQVKQERDEIASAKNALQAQLASLSTIQSASSAEVQSLKHRIEDVEREKRDLIGVVSRLKGDSTQREEEIQTLRSNLKQARQDQQSLESQLRELRSTETSTKFKIDSLTQQLQLSKDEAERTSKDLTEKMEESSKYRRTKHAELAQLQAAHDSLVQTHASTESTLKALQSAHNTQSHQLTQALARVQDLNGQLAEQEAAYTSEAAGLRRLNEMMQERELQAKAVVDGIEKEWAVVGERADRREAVLREEIDAQRQRAESAEKRVVELKSVLDRMDRGEFPIPNGSAPGTPARGFTTPARNSVPDFLTQGMVGLSPTVAIASRVQRGGKTFTEVYGDYVKLQEEFAKQSVEYKRMDETLSSVLAQIEERAPVLAQQRQEYERLQSEASQLAFQLAQALADRDANATAAADSTQKLAKSTRENEFLAKQLDDLGHQIQTLLKELGRRQDPSIPSDEELEEDPAVQPAENIEAVITNNLVLFRSIPGLQEQNQKLLKIVRELGAKMEAEEKDYREALEKEQGEAVREAHEAIKLLQEQLETHKHSSEVTIQAYLTEREALKATLARERSAGSSRAINGTNGHDSAGGVEVSEELAEVQDQFETFKTEMSVDSGRLREDLLNAQRESAQLGTALAKANAKIDYLNDRHRMLQEQTSMQRAELDSLSRRNSELYDQYTRIDIECNRYSEDLLSTKGVSEQLRNECANLRAEKKIWESVQSRIVEENRTLTVERSQLSDLMSNVQRMHSDLERSGENDRRRLESQIQMLESQTQDLRVQLQQERDSVRHISLQKDIELKELRTKIEKISQDHSQAREALAVADTSKKHYQEQVEQLTRQVKGAEEKLAVYERRSTGINGVVPSQEQELSREQQLEAEVADLRAALKVAEVDLATARSHVQQFQEISKANEAALASLNATYDEYKSATEAQITSRESDFIALEDKFDDFKKEHLELQEKVKEMQKTFDIERVAWANDKKTLEGTIFDMSTSEKNVESDRASRENEVRQQEERAKAAEERYSREVLAHAEAIKSIDDLRQQLNKSLVTSRDGQAASETAQAKLAASEASWKQQKEALDKEVADLNTRCKDLTAQNGLLHQHLESVSTQAARIRQAADSSTPDRAEIDGNDDADTKLAELRSVVAYLRKEKEIVDLQLELSKQENLRLKTQIDHLSQNLEETRKTLSEERERAVEISSSEAQHAELVERINQLTILRESNATLRADCEAHAKRARSLNAKLQEVSAELDPVKEQLRVARAELEAREKQVNRLEDETQMWQKRNTQLLSKYDRIDPADVQALRDQIQKLELEKEEMKKTADGIAAQLEISRQTTEKLKDIGKRNNAVIKSRTENFAKERASWEEKLKELESQIASISAERDTLRSQSTTDATTNSQHEQSLRQELDTLRTAHTALEKAIVHERDNKSATEPPPEHAGLILQLTQERDSLVAEKAALTSRLEASIAGTSAGETSASWETERTVLAKARDEALSQVQNTSKQLNEALDKIKQFQHSSGTFQNRIQELTKARMADKEAADAQLKTAVETAVQKVREEMQASTPALDVVKKHQEELRVLEERLLKKHQEDLKTAVDAAKASSTTGDTDQNALVQAAVSAAIAAREQEFARILDAEKTKAMESGRLESQAKAKLKDGQLVRAQARLKDFEVQIKDLQDKGIIPAARKASAVATAKPAVPSNATAGPSQVAPSPAAPVTRSTSGSAAASSSSLPQKPSTTTGASRGRGGAPRGGPRNLVSAAGLAIRGAAPVAADATTGTSGGVSISGAVAKRAREDGDGADTSLAKRLKPATTAVTGGGPVQFNRNRVPPPAPQ